MDSKTIATYDTFATRYASEWMSTTPQQIQRLVDRFFRVPGTVMDVGAGTGRDVSWLHDKGFEVTGVDASRSLLDIAKSRNPDVSFVQESLPNLSGIADASAQFVLCSAVLMHLEKPDIPKAIRTLLRVLMPGGRVICSVRPSRETSEREHDGRLYTLISRHDLGDLFTRYGAVILASESTSDGVGGTQWLTIVGEKVSPIPSP